MQRSEILRLLASATAILLALPTIGGGAAPKALPIYGGQFSALSKSSKPHYNLGFAISGVDPGSDAGEIDILIAATSPRDHYRLRVAKWVMTLSSVEGGKARAVRQARLPQGKSSSHSILIKRRPRFMSIVWDNRLVLSALDDTHKKGVCCVRTDQGAKAGQGRHQAVEPIVFSDSFMQTEDEAKTLRDWEVVSGDWGMHSVIDRTRANPDARIRAGYEPEAQRSANPFSLSGLGTKGAIAVTGHNFWDDYEATAAAKTLGGEMGLVFNYVGQDHHHLLRWSIESADVKPGRVQLVKVYDGREAILGTKQVLARRDNWYELRVRAVRGKIEAFIDNTLIFAVDDAQAIGGKIGAYARGEGAAIFDDFEVESVEEITFDTKAMLGHAASSRQGDWLLQQRDGSAWATASALPPGKRALCLLGSNRWHPGLHRVTLDLSKLSGCAGLTFAAKGPSDYWATFVQARPLARVGVLRIADGKKQIVAEAPCDGVAALNDLAVDLRTGRAIRVYVDNRLELRAPASTSLAGAVGLYAEGQGSAAFGDLRAFTDRDTDWEAEVQREIFVDDPYMQGWASRRWQWKSGTPLGDRTRFVHKGDFYGAFRCEMPVSAPFALRFGEDEFGSQEKGYAFEVALGTCRFALRRAGKNVWASAPAEQPKSVIGPITLQREGKCIWARAGGTEIMNYRDATPLRGTGVAIVADERFDLSAVAMRRDHVLDYTFETAPKDWLKVGEWAVTNRFWCDPRWSHMNGRSRGLAALWHKYAMERDVTIECYAGMRMRQGNLRKGVTAFYPRVGDINFSLCGDGQDLFSGYNFVLQSWDRLWSERWSKLLRLDQIVGKTDREFIPRTRDHSAQTRPIEVEWDPGGRPVHGAWYYIKLRKRGSRLDLTFDGEPVLSHTDPKPLLGKHVALWTQDNSIVVARMKVSYERRAPGAGRLVPAPTQKEPLPARDDPIRITSLTHPSVAYDFESSLHGWREGWVDQGAVLTLDKRPDGKGQCLRLTNAYPGGDAGAEIPVQRMELSRVEQLEFEYCLTPGAHVNLYLQLEGEKERFHFVRLSGSQDTSENMRLVAEVPNAKADGKWRWARVPLAQALKARYPGRRSFVLEWMAIGNWHEGYLNAGLGGNKAGATYWIDSFSMTGWGPSAAVIDWRPAEGNELTQYAVCLDRSPTTSPPDASATSDTLKVFDKLSPGTSYFHIKGRRPDGSWSPVQHYPIHVSGPLNVTQITPPPGAHWGGEPIQVSFGESPSVKLVPGQTKLTLNGQKMAYNEYAFRYDPAKQVLTLHLNRCGLSFANAARAAFALGYQSSLAVTPAKSPPKGVKAPSVTIRSGAHEWQYVMDYDRDKTPPSRVTTDKCLVDHDFETSVSWTPYGGANGAALVRDTTTAASGEASLKLVNHLLGGNFGATVYPKAFTVGQYPFVSFDYKTDGAARADLWLYGSNHSVVQFTDNDTTYPRVGKVPELQADGKWHHAAFNLRRMFDAAPPVQSSQLYQVSRLLLSDTGHMANPPGVSYHIDNFRISPVLCGRQPVTIKLSAHDLGGIAGYSHKWSPKPDDVPDKEIDTTQSQATFAKLPEGESCFHVAARDSAGNWGPVSHYRFLIDNTPPAVKALHPSPNSASVGPAITVQIQDDQSGLNPATLKLTMNGRSYSLSQQTTQYDPTAGELVWDWVASQPAMTQPIADKSTMQLKLDSIQDFAGNGAKPAEWSWQIDYAQDKVGPGRPELSCQSRPPTTLDTFTTGVGQWYTYRPNSFERYFDEERLDWCAKVTKSTHQRMWVYARRGYYHTSSYPMVSFDYQFPKGIKLQLVVWLEGVWLSVKMTTAAVYPCIGEVPGIVADGKWRHVAFDLDKTLKTAGHDTTSKRVYYIAFGGGLPNDNSLGTTFYVDNFCISGDGPPLPRFAWTSRDSTGVAGVSFVFDKQPRTAPDTSIDASVRDLSLPVIDAAGLYYLHVRARDGAGNWGGAEHHPYYATAAASPTGPDHFEADSDWVVHNTKNGAALTMKPAATPGGKNRLLALHYSGKANRSFGISLPSPLDLSGKERLLMDVHHGSASAVTAYVYFSQKGRNAYYIGKPQTISKQGWTQGVAFPLTGNVFRSPSSKTYTDKIADPSQISGMLLVFSSAAKSGDLLLDRVRLE